MKLFNSAERDFDNLVKFVDHLPEILKTKFHQFTHPTKKARLIASVIIFLLIGTASSALAYRMLIGPVALNAPASKPKAADITTCPNSSEINQSRCNGKAVGSTNCWGDDSVCLYYPSENECKCVDTSNAGAGGTPCYPHSSGDGCKNYQNVGESCGTDAICSRRSGTTEVACDCVSTKAPEDINTCPSSGNTDSSCNSKSTGTVCKQEKDGNGITIYSTCSINSSSKTCDCVKQETIHLKCDPGSGAYSSCQNRTEGDTCDNGWGTCKRTGGDYRCECVSNNQCNKENNGTCGTPGGCPDGKRCQPDASIGGVGKYACYRDSSCDTGTPTAAPTPTATPTLAPACNGTCVNASSAYNCANVWKGNFTSCRISDSNPAAGNCCVPPIPTATPTTAKPHCGNKGESCCENGADEWCNGSLDCEGGTCVDNYVPPTPTATPKPHCGNSGEPCCGSGEQWCNGSLDCLSNGKCGTEPTPTPKPASVSGYCGSASSCGSCYDVLTSCVKTCSKCSDPGNSGTGIVWTYCASHSGSCKN